MIFKKGDRVRYNLTQFPGLGFSEYRAGHEGTVMSSDFSDTRVTWDIPHKGVTQSGHYTKNFQLAEVPYDPTQQGETDDDI